MFHKFLVHTDKRSVSWEAEVWALCSGDFEDGLGVGQSWGGVNLLAEKPLPKALIVQDSRSPEHCHLDLLFSSLLRCPYRGHVVSQRWWYLMGCFVGSDKKACACGLWHLFFAKCDKVQTQLFFYMLHITVILCCFTPMFDSYITLVNKVSLETHLTFAEIAHSVAARCLMWTSQEHTTSVHQSS